LVQLGQAKPVGPVQDQGVYVGQIQTRFDDGGAHQNVGFAGGERQHNVFQF